jgi:hypothetical protein
VDLKLVLVEYDLFLIGNSQNAAKNAHFFHKSFMNLFVCECTLSCFLSIKIG